MLVVLKKMSEFYDSLEDEGDDFKGSFDSLQEIKTNSLPLTGNYENSEQYDCHSLFHLNNSSPKDAIDDCYFKQYKNVTKDHLKQSETNFENKIYLPKIKNNKLTGVKKAPPFVDSEALNKQGLQLNIDGSFTKSPRSEFEKLPFVSREYQNLQFQNKIIPNVKKRAPPAKINKKNMFTFSEKSENEISMIQLINARKKKSSSEELLTSGSSEKGSEKLVESDNLTDTMKEIILKKQYISTSKSCKTLEKDKKIKKVFNSFDNTHGGFYIKHESAGVLHLSKKNNNLKCQPKARSEAQFDIQDRKSKLCFPKINKPQSGILVNAAKPSLSYSERHLIEKGFNPLHLQFGIKKPPSDTSRSNFGDSMVDKLSEVSSRILSGSGFTNENEELFYRNIIEKEKKELLKAQKGLQLVNSFESKRKKIDSTEWQSCREKKITSNPKQRRVSKSTFIDLPNEKNCSLEQLRKKSHYCSANSSPCISKTELAIKAKTYGYLANARNIFKLKTQSEAKISSCSFNLKKESEKSSFNATVISSANKLSSQNLLPGNISKYGNDKMVLNFPKTSRSLCKTKQFKEQSSTILDQVDCADNIKFGSEILRRINSCLSGSSFRVEDILYHGLRKEDNYLI